jgi:hypothetical protein
MLYLQTLNRRDTLRVSDKFCNEERVRFVDGSRVVECGPDCCYCVCTSSEMVIEGIKLDSRLACCAYEKVML